MARGHATTLVVMATPQAAGAPEGEHASSSARRRGPRWRRWTAVALAVLASIVVAVAVTGVWLRATAMDTDHWLKVVGPIGRDSRVQAALADYTSGQLESSIDTEALLQDRLPSRLQPLAAPLSTAVNTFVTQESRKFFESDAFERLWVAANRRAHADAVAVLRGNHKVAVVRNGQVTLDLLPVMQQILERVNDATHGALAKRIPAITQNLTPDEARARLSSALHRQLPDNFGVIVVFNDKQLDTLQKAVQWFQRLVVLLVVLGSVLIGLTLLVATDRRRITVWLGLGIAIAMVAFRATARAAGRHVVTRVVVPENRDAARAVVDSVLSSYLAVTLVAVVVGLLAALIAYLAGPGRGAVAIRSRVTRWDWIREHAGALALAVLAVAALVVIFATLSFGWLIVLAAVVAAVEIVLVRLRRPAVTPVG